MDIGDDKIHKGISFDALYAHDCGWFVESFILYDWNVCEAELCPFSLSVANSFIVTVNHGVVCGPPAFHSFPSGWFEPLIDILLPSW